MSLDMSKFLSSTDQTSPRSPNDSLYELRGILLHKGSSAYHGHYEAQVYDTAYGPSFHYKSRRPLISCQKPVLVPVQ